MFNVQADGDWTIDMSQYVPEDLEKDSFEGKGDDVRFIEIEQGARTFELTHNGERNFIVQVNNQVFWITILEITKVLNCKKSKILRFIILIY